MMESKKIREYVPSSVFELKKKIEEGRNRIGLILPDNSFQAFFWYRFHKIFPEKIWLIARDSTAAHFLYSDLKNFRDDSVLLFPSSMKHLQNPGKADIFDLHTRISIWQKILSENNTQLIVTYPEAFLEKIPGKNWFLNEGVQIGKDDKLDPEFLNEMLFEWNYERVDVVTEPGEFAWFGRVMDVFPFGFDFPVRLEFDFDAIEKIRLLDTETQLSEKEVGKIKILPVPVEEIEWTDIPSNISEKQAVYSPSFESLEDLSRSIPKDSHVVNRVNTFFSVEQFHEKQILISSQFKNQDFIRTKIDDLPVFGKVFENFLKFFRENQEKNFVQIISSSDTEQLNRLKEIMDLQEGNLKPEFARKNFFRGFTDPENQFVLIPEHQIFDRPAKKFSHTWKQKKQKSLLRDISQWEKGDYIVHTDYGIGIYEGLVKIEKNGQRVEVVKLRYKDGDTLYVSIHSLYKLSKYRGKDGKPPKIHRMGSASWEHSKQKTKKRIKKLAFDLISLYAERKKQKGFAFGPDSVMQWELEASFMYEDTPDQKKATEEVKRDMESERPMDRLICGDVGFGKTEIAIRAAFKAVDNGKQVAVLVPTTILAFQHYQTFNERLKNFPVTVDYLNRFRSTAERNKILKDLSEGKIDIIIGTHILTRDKVKFKDLGLLIIDEEQKFGVNVKDKIKQLKKNVDVLTLTATPIPRTLQFSLMGERDLSVINTPPPNRFPVETQIIKFHPGIIREAIEKELNRGGQIFFVHNRIENISQVAELLRNMFPHIKIAVAHGKTEGKQLERIMMDFRSGKYDILVSTAIVESGLDVPNANTIFVNNAHQFGLADLHQLRGRVGRSNRKAYCYFIIPSYDSLTEEARKRIDTLETYTSLGDGFEIAMKDLEIRGAGDLLGAEQSGFINELGFEMYQKIMQEAVEELKAEAFGDLFDKEEFQGLDNVQIQTDRQWQIPDRFIPSGKERMYYYRRLNEVKSADELKRLKEEIQDRFGKIPVETSYLLQLPLLKSLASELGFERIVFKNGLLRLFFTNHPKFAGSDIWPKILQYLSSNTGCCELKKKKEKIYLEFQNVYNPEDAMKILNRLSRAVFVK